MNRPPSVSTIRYSVNNPATTFQPPQHDTTAKLGPTKRFSYQDSKDHQSGQLKENFASSQNKQSSHRCLNHPDLMAPYSALQDTTDPMHLCERCAILVASKGFQISKVNQGKPKKQELPQNDIKTSISTTFNHIKTNKNHTADKLSTIQLQLKCQEQQIDEYFNQLVLFLGNKKQSYLKEVCIRRKELEHVRHQANKYYMTMLEKVRQISRDGSNVSTDISGQFSYYLQELSKGTYKIPTQKVTGKLEFKPVDEMTECIIKLFSKEPQKQLRTQRQFKQECEQDNSSIRSLQLSFEENNDGTLRQGTDEFKGIQSNISSNLLNSMGYF